MDKQKMYLINTMVVKGSALADRITSLRAEADKESSTSTSSTDEETNLVQQMDDVFYELQKWVDVEDKKVRG